MEGIILLCIIVGGVILGGICLAVPKKDSIFKQAKKSAKAKKDAKIVCPHCQTTGHVRTKQTTVKKGISGGKATAAILTGGVSILATGLSQCDSMTQATCSNCGSTWMF